MSDYNVYLKVPEYLAQWIAHTFGNPVELIKDSPEMRLLNELLVKMPCDKLPDTGESSNIIIPIPYFKGKDPATYNYLYDTGKAAMEESFSSLFKKDLFNSITDLKKCFKEGGRIKRSTLIYTYMEKHGIDEKYWDTIAQIFHRMEIKYSREKDIKVG
jgi:hypothetical protein